jgi:SsrA-binding protein
MAAKKETKPRFTEARNAKVHRDYFVGETVEAGLVLTGTEVKAIREGKAQINESFARIEPNGNPVLYHAHIEEYSHGNRHNHNPVRPRKLLLHKKEILRLKHEIEAGGQALIPTRLYFKQGLVKVALALCKGKKQYDKRDDLKKKTALREADRAISWRR